jgi:hypothetical protein
MPPIDADLHRVDFEGDKLITHFVARCEATRAGATRVLAVRLAEARPDERGQVVVLESVEEPGIELSAEREWEGRFAWGAAASARVRALGQAMLLIVADGEPPMGLAFRVATGPGDRAMKPALPRRWRLVPLVALVAFVAALVIARSCA